MANKLVEIEKNYAQDLIKFFCEEYTRMHQNSILKDDYKNLKMMLNRQIEKRLYDKSLIIDWMVRIENLKLEQIRDIKLSRILNEGDDEVVVSYIIVDFKLNKFTESFQVKHNITIEDLSK